MAGRLTIAAYGVFILIQTLGYVLANRPGPGINLFPHQNYQGLPITVRLNGRAWCADLPEGQYRYGFKSVELLDSHCLRLCSVKCLTRQPRVNHCMTIRTNRRALNGNEAVYFKTIRSCH